MKLLKKMKQLLKKQDPAKVSSNKNKKLETFEEKIARLKKQDPFIYK